MVKTMSREFFPPNFRHFSGDEDYSGGESAAFEFEHTDYLGDESSPGRGPQCFRVEIPQPEFKINAHFHFVDQFQVVISGGGTLARRPYEALTVHYTDSYTTYGPIVVGGDGLGWFTFRCQSDTGAQVMPGARPKLTRRPGRSFTCAVPETVAAGDGEVTMRTVIGVHPDGLASYDVCAGPGASVIEPAVGGSGRYSLVVEGTVTCDGGELAPQSVIFSRPGDVVAYTAGPTGARVVVLQLPVN
jgi:hypothetical protein